MLLSNFTNFVFGAIRQPKNIYIGANVIILRKHIL